MKRFVYHLTNGHSLSSEFDDKSSGIQIEILQGNLGVVYVVEFKNPDGSVVFVPWASILWIEIYDLDDNGERRGRGS